MRMLVHIQIVRRDDGTQAVPIFPADRVKTVEGLTGTVTRSTLTRVDITFNDGKKSWRKPENLVSLEKFAKSTGGLPKKKVAAVAQGQNSDSDDSSDEESYSSTFARALQDIYDYGSDGGQGEQYEEAESEDNSEDGN